jgi:hypothetical protein
VIQHPTTPRRRDRRHRGLAALASPGCARVAGHRLARRRAALGGARGARSRRGPGAGRGDGHRQGCRRRGLARARRRAGIAAGGCRAAQRGRRHSPRRCRQGRSLAGHHLAAGTPRRHGGLRRRRAPARLRRRPGRSQSRRPARGGAGRPAALRGRPGPTAAPGPHHRAGRAAGGHAGRGRGAGPGGARPGPAALRPLRGLHRGRRRRHHRAVGRPLLAGPAPARGRDAADGCRSGGRERHVLFAALPPQPRAGLRPRARHDAGRDHPPGPGRGVRRR